MNNAEFCYWRWRLLCFLFRHGFYQFICIFARKTFWWKVIFQLKLHQVNLMNSHFFFTWNPCWMGRALLEFLNASKSAHWSWLFNFFLLILNERILIMCIFGKIYWMRKLLIIVSHSFCELNNCNYEMLEFDGLCHLCAFLKEEDLRWMGECAQTSSK